MKFYINIVVFAAISLYFINATEFSEEQIRMFLPFIKRWIPPPCPMNELYRSCTGKCSDCTQRGRCIVTNCEEGCDCAPRFFRVTPDGPCEPVANCPKPECGENEIFRECGPICETCTLLECHVISCDHKCYCKEGYRRNMDGVCIPKDECYKRSHCTRDEKWAVSGPIDEFCLPAVEEDISNNTQNVPGCYCKEGHKRNLLGHCVNETLCPIIRCFGVEVYHDCIPKCNTTCRNYGDLECSEDDNCYPGCFCPPGYVMNDFRSCIKIENCSLDIDQLKVIYGRDEDDNTTDTTLPPTCATTDETTLADDSASADDTTKPVTEKSIKEAEKVSVRSSEQTVTYASPTSVTTLADDSASADDTTKPVTEKNIKEEEKVSVRTSEQAVTHASPTSVTPVSSSTAKEKASIKEKVLKQKGTKHENVAKDRDAYKYKFAEDEDGFGNDDI